MEGEREREKKKERERDQKGTYERNICVFYVDQGTSRTKFAQFLFELGSPKLTNKTNTVACSTFASLSGEVRSQKAIYMCICMSVLCIYISIYRSIFNSIFQTFYLYYLSIYLFMCRSVLLFTYILFYSSRFFASKFATFVRLSQPSGDTKMVVGWKS